MKTTPKTPSNRDPRSALLLPPPGLSNCLFGAFIRDSRGCRLSHQDRFNYFAASPLFCISWRFEGELHLLQNGGQVNQPQSAPVFPKLAVSGPQLVPRTSWSPGPIHMLVVAFHADAFVALTGIKAENYLNQNLPAESVLNGELLKLAETVQSTGDAYQGYAMIERELNRQWQKIRPHTSTLSRFIDDWTTSLATRAYLSATGRSVRQVERRIRAWTGQSLRSLNKYARNDRAFESALAAKERGTMHIAEMSTELGYSDQAHLTREIKKQTGFTPAELLRRMETEEAFWSFRLLGERY